MLGNDIFALLIVFGVVVVGVFVVVVVVILLLIVVVSAVIAVIILGGLGADVEYNCPSPAFCQVIRDGLVDFLERNIFGTIRYDMI